MEERMKDSKEEGRGESFADMLEKSMAGAAGHEPSAPSLSSACAGARIPERRSGRPSP